MILKILEVGIEHYRLLSLNPIHLLLLHRVESLFYYFIRINPYAPRYLYVNFFSIIFRGYLLFVLLFFSWISMEYLYIKHFMCTHSF